MICAECDRCRRRSILSPRSEDDSRMLNPPPGERAVSLRCDLCGNRRVRLVRVASAFEAVAFVNGRLTPGTSEG